MCSLHVHVLQVQIAMVNLPLMSSCNFCQDPLYCVLLEPAALASSKRGSLILPATRNSQLCLCQLRAIYELLQNDGYDALTKFAG